MSNIRCETKEMRQWHTASKIKDVIAVTATDEVTITGRNGWVTLSAPESAELGRLLLDAERFVRMQESK